MRRVLLKTILAILALCVLHTSSAHASGGAKSEVPVGPQYVEMDPLLLPIIDDKGISQQVSLVVKLEVTDGTKVEEVKSMMPKIVDALVQDLYGTLSTQNAYLANGVLRLDLVKARLKTTAAKIVEGEVITDVLLQVVQQHRV